MIIFFEKKRKEKEKKKLWCACLLLLLLVLVLFVTYATRDVKDELETLVLHERVENIIWNRLKDYNKFHAYGMAY